MQIILPNRRKAFQSAGGNGLLSGLIHHVDLASSLLDDVGAGDMTQANTSVSSGTAPDGGDSRLFAIGGKLESAAGNIWGSGTTMTLSVWTYITSSVGSIVGHNAPNGYSWFSYLASSINLRWFFDATFLGDVTGTSAQNNWRHLVFTSTGPAGTDEVFIDAVSRDTGTGGWEPGSAVFYLGANHNGAANFIGEMVGLSIWDRVLTSDDITALYNSGVNLRYADYTA